MRGRPIFQPVRNAPGLVDHRRPMPRLRGDRSLNRPEEEPQHRRVVRPRRAPGHHRPSHRHPPEARSTHCASRNARGEVPALQRRPEHPGDGRHVHLLAVQGCQPSRAAGRAESNSSFIGYPVSRTKSCAVNAAEDSIEVASTTSASWETSATSREIADDETNTLPTEVASPETWRIGQVRAIPDRRGLGDS